MDLKQLVGSSAFFMINKTIMQKVGLEAALLLQHLIDIEDSFFKGIEFYQQVSRLKLDTGLSEHGIRVAKKALIKENAISITKKGLPSKDHFVINHSNIKLWFENETTTDSKSEPLEDQKYDHKYKESSIQKIKESNTILDETSTNKIVTKVIDKEEEAKAKIFFKLVDMYPKNKIGNRQHGLKKFKELDIKQALAAIKNVDRYLKTVNEPKFVKSLLNYLDQECWDEEYLKLEETKSKPKDITNTKEFDTNY
jgi:hypothetical protein